MLAALASTCRADAFTDAASQLPPCGVSMRSRPPTWIRRLLTSSQLQCALSELPKSVCQITDPACICTNQPLAELMEACILSTCKPADAIGKKLVRGERHSTLG